jgi:hypothetical protein
MAPTSSWLRLSDEMPDQLRVEPLAKLIPDVGSISRGICTIASATNIAPISVQSQHDSLIGLRSLGLKSRYCSLNESPIQHAHNCTIRAIIEQYAQSEHVEMLVQALGAVKRGRCAGK